jgi:hypothetical protein
MRTFAPVSTAEHWCHFSEDYTKDAWERPIYYGSAGKTPAIASAGKDGQFTTEDDIVTPTDTNNSTVPDGGKDCLKK